jgi:hypothetical protein
MYVPLEPPRDKKMPGIPRGMIDSSGNYEIVTEGRFGAPLGKYKVWISPNMVPGPLLPRLPLVKGMVTPKAYMSPETSKLIVEVVANAPPGFYDLQLTSN